MKKILSTIISVLVIIAFAMSSFAFGTVAVQSIKLSASKATLNAGTTYMLKVAVTPTNATNKKLTYSTSNKAVATVDANGKVTAVKSGKATITVASVQNPKATAKFDVTVVSIYGGILRILIGGDPAAIGNASALATTGDYFAAEPALEPLGRFDNTGVLQPWLAESFSADFATLTATVKIKKGIKFSDGTDLNADAVIWNWKQYTAAGRSELASVDTYEKVDDYTAKAHLKVWDNGIINNLGYYGGFMNSPTAFEKNGRDWTILNPVGTGPFVLAKWNRGTSIVYQKNPNYWRKGEPYLDSIIFNVIKDNTTRTSALRTKEGDLLLDLSDYNLVDQLKRDGFTNITKVTGMGSVINGFFFNSTDEKSPFYKLEVRQAVQYASDNKQVNQVMTLGNGIYTNQWASPTAWSYNKNVTGYPYNVAKAKELLAKAGYPNGFETTINCANNQLDVLRCTILQASLKAIGITAKINSMEQAKYNEMNGATGHWDGIALWASKADPDISMTYPRNLTAQGSRFINGTPHPQDLVDLMAAAKSAQTMTEKTKLCQDMSKMLMDKYAYIMPQYITSPAIMTTKKVQDTGFGEAYWTYWTPNTAKIVK